MVHGPPGGPQLRRESWEEVVKFYEEEKDTEGGEKLLRSIGVSNFGVGHLEEVRRGWKKSGGDVEDDKEWKVVKPSVNQVDVHR